MPKLFTVTAEVHHSAKITNGYRVKISLPELGIYINGMMVFPPHDQYPDWSVVPPSKLKGRGIWVGIIEFNKKLPLWQEIHDACIDAAKLEHQLTEDVVVEDIPDGPINLDAIPFF